MFMDTSSELIHSILPVFMATTLGASIATIGLIEGIAEAAAAFSKVFSGLLSDYFQKRKSLAVAGYGLAAITKPIFPLATSIWWVLVARFVDRIGKGIRAAPRDALVRDLAHQSVRGAAYGLRQALDSVGAFLGPLIALVFMACFDGDIRVILWAAVPPAFLAVALLVIGIHEPEPNATSTDQNKYLSLTDVKRLGLSFWLVVLVGSIFTIARFSEAFLVLRARDVGMQVAYLPMVMIVMNVTYSTFAYPAGAASDRYSASTLLLAGLGVLILADIVLALAKNYATVLLGSGLWGLHMALTQGLFLKLVADTAPQHLSGTAFGIFHLISGASFFLANTLAGLFWNSFGAFTTFVFGALFTAISAMGLIFYRLWTHSNKYRFKK
jgi:MFS family permease